jgi:hypothetical protein
LFAALALTLTRLFRQGGKDSEGLKIAASRGGSERVMHGLIPWLRVSRRVQLHHKSAFTVQGLIRPFLRTPKRTPKGLKTILKNSDELC